MGFKLESLHLYRKVPRDLTDATSVGGAISLVCAMVMAYLFVSNILLINILIAMLSETCDHFAWRSNSPTLAWPHTAPKPDSATL